MVLVAKAIEELRDGLEARGLLYSLIRMRKKRIAKIFSVLNMVFHPTPM
jgi:hypothetical protein